MKKLILLCFGLALIGFGFTSSVQLATLMLRDSTPVAIDWSPYNSSEIAVAYNNGVIDIWKYDFLGTPSNGGVPMSERCENAVMVVYF